VGLLAFTSIAPEPGHARRRTEFPGLCLLRARNRERTPEINRRFRRAGFGTISAISSAIRWISALHQLWIAVTTGTNVGISSTGASWLRGLRSGQALDLCWACALPAAFKGSRRWISHRRRRSALRAGVSALVHWSQAGRRPARSLSPVPSPQSSVRPRGLGRAKRY
jgi:hypothetical protein